MATGLLEGKFGWNANVIRIGMQMSSEDLSDIELAASFDINSVDSEFISNPFPMCRALRKHSPMHKNKDGSLFLTRYADVMEAYRHPAMSSDKKIAFKEKFGDGALYKHHTTSLIFNDPPYHTVVRKLLSAGFTPRKLRDMEPLISKIVDGLLDRLSDYSEFDLVKDYAMTLPTEIISFMLGIPEEYRSRLRQYSLDILGALDPVISQDRVAAGNAAVDEFGEVLEGIIEKRQRASHTEGEGEILMALILGEVDGRKLSTSELVQNCIFLLNAGHETTTSLVANTMHMLFETPDQFSRLKKNPDLISTTIEESLRTQSPLQIGNRVTTEDVKLGGQLLPAGTYIHLSVAGANRDPAEFYHPETIDVARKPNRHVAFAMGHHVCLGATLARMEGKIAIGRLIERFSKIEPAGPAKNMGLARFRGFNDMPVRV